MSIRPLRPAGSTKGLDELLRSPAATSAGVVLATALVYAIGDLRLPLVLTYCLPVAFAAQASRRAGLAVAAASAVCFALARVLTATASSLDALDVGLGAALLGLTLAVLAVLLSRRAEGRRNDIRASHPVPADLCQERANSRSTAVAAPAPASDGAARGGRTPRSRSAPIMRVAHQLRAPVAAIQSCLDVVLQGYLDHSPEQQRLLLQSARDSAAELLALSGDVLRLGELRDWPLATPQAPVDVGEVAAHLVEEWRAEAAVRAITITLEADPDLPPVLGQRLYLEEMLRNLVDNAVKYNLPGGSVRLRLTRVGDELRGEVRDTGIGIPSRDLPFIFDEFYRAENAKETITRGTGLGLPIVKQVVELHGGTIKASSNLGKGAAFTFLLPAATETEPGPASTPSRGTRPYETVGESRARGQE